jgi:hypothetical protein
MQQQGQQQGRNSHHEWVRGVAVLKPDEARLGAVAVGVTAVEPSVHSVDVLGVPRTHTVLWTAIVEPVACCEGRVWHCET